MHREVFWFERYAPPEPGMVLVDVQLINNGTRFLSVWIPRRAEPSYEICCWSDAESDPESS